MFLHLGDYLLDRGATPLGISARASAMPDTWPFQVLSSFRERERERERERDGSESDNGSPGNGTTA
jgi:hypothetical protein